jgi:hypothetical protein
MAKCTQSKSHSHLWWIKKKAGNKVTVFCLACEFEWDSTGKQYEHLPMLTEEEKKKHLVGKYD